MGTFLLKGPKHSVIGVIVATNATSRLPGIEKMRRNTGTYRGFFFLVNKSTSWQIRMDKCVYWWGKQSVLPVTSLSWLLRVSKFFHRPTMRKKVSSSSWKRGVVTQQQLFGLLYAHSQSHLPQGRGPVQLAVCETATPKPWVSFIHWQKRKGEKKKDVDWWSCT